METKASLSNSGTWYSALEHAAALGILHALENRSKETPHGVMQLVVRHISPDGNVGYLYGHSKHVHNVYKAAYAGVRLSNNARLNEINA